MFFHSFTEGAEHHSMLSKLLLVGGGNGNAVKDSIHSHVAQTFLLTQRNPELVERFQKLGINLIEAGFFLLLLGSCVINDVLIIDRVVPQLGPIRLLKGQPMPERLEAELKQKIGLLLLLGDQTHHLLAETFGDLVGLDLRDEAVLVRLANEITGGGGCHVTQPAVAWMVSVVIVCSSPRKGLSSVRKSMQWHSLRSRIGTQGQFQKACETSASLSS